MPLLPLFIFTSVGMNVYIMLSLTSLTWLRFFVWLLIGKIQNNIFVRLLKFYSIFQIKGLVIYFSYGIRHSLENKNRNTQKSCFKWCCNKSKSDLELAKF